LFEKGAAPTPLLFLKRNSMKCLVLEGFAGMTYASARGKEIDLPIAEARSLAAQGIVRMIEDYTPEIAYETADEAMGRKAVKKVGKKS
jgi:hypothetical protein